MWTHLKLLDLFELDSISIKVIHSWISNNQAMKNRLKLDSSWVMVTLNGDGENPLRPMYRLVSWKSLNSFAQRWSIFFNLYNLLLTILRVNYSQPSSNQLKMFSGLATSCLFSSRFLVIFFYYLCIRDCHLFSLKVLQNLWSPDSLNSKFR